MGRTLAAAVAVLALVVVPQALAKQPTATTGGATSVGATTAVVTGKVDPGGEATSWYVEYGVTTSYGSRTDTRSAGNGTGQVDVTEQLRSLTTGVTYHYRLVATNVSGTSRGADATFQTRSAPAVVTANAWALGPSSATVGGSVDPNGRSTGWWIEYGTSTGYGSRTDTGSAGSATEPVSVSLRLNGLRAGVTYHFRLVAANDLGTTRGADRSFRTDRGPSVATGGADTITVSTARVTGSVNPNGRGTAAWFEFGTSTSLGSRTGDLNAGFGTRSTPIEAQLAGLQPGTRYYYRLLARSDAATTAGNTRSFTTSAGPLATTGQPQVTGVNVVLTGSVDPVGRPTNWWFELGTTTSYGTSTVVQSASSGLGCTSTVAVKLHVSSSEAGRSYSYWGCAIGWMRELAAAFQNQPPIWLSTASVNSRSSPRRARSTCVGTLPGRKPGTLTLPARSEVACSTAWRMSSRGTSTLRRTLLPASSSTWTATRPFKQTGFACRQRARVGHAPLRPLPPW